VCSSVYRVEEEEEEEEEEEIERESIIVRMRNPRTLGSFFLSNDRLVFNLYR
jgi:hypothetical protein